MKSYMKISEFAKVTGISRRNLIFYDKIELLSPAVIDAENRYRYYTYYQIDTASVITVLREIGMPLKEIKNYLNKRTPKLWIDLMDEQKKKIEDRIRTLTQINDMLDMRTNLIKEGLQAEENINTITLQECEETPLFMGPELPADGHALEGWYYLLDYYEYCEENQIIRGLPAGSLIDHGDLIRGNIVRPSRFFCRPISGSSYLENGIKPKGLYVVAQEYTEYAKSERLYARLFRYIEENNFKICGHAYENVLLDEISIIDPTQYLMQIAIHVEKIN